MKQKAKAVSTKGNIKVDANSSVEKFFGEVHAGLVAFLQAKIDRSEKLKPEQITQMKQLVENLKQVNVTKNLIATLFVLQNTIRFLQVKLKLLDVEKCPFSDAKTFIDITTYKNLHNDVLCLIRDYDRQKNFATMLSGIRESLDDNEAFDYLKHEKDFAVSVLSEDVDGEFVLKPFELQSSFYLYAYHMLESFSHWVKETLPHGASNDSTLAGKFKIGIQKSHFSDCEKALRSTKLKEVANTQFTNKSAISVSPLGLYQQGKVEGLDQFNVNNTVDRSKLSIRG